MSFNYSSYSLFLSPLEYFPFCSLSPAAFLALCWREFTPPKNSRGENGVSLKIYGMFYSTFNIFSFLLCTLL
jgi:hypothetical protein